MEEIWKDVVGYEGFYMVSNLGRIKSLYRCGTIKKEKIRIQAINKYGYLILNLNKNSRTKTFLVHRLVARSFIKEIDFKKQINHINTIKTDNRVENLEYVTCKENIEHAFENNLIKKFKVKAKNIKTGEELFFDSVREAERNGFPKTSVHRNLNGEIKSCRNFIFEKI